MSIPYVGSGPYCYSNSLAMMLGYDAPGPSTIEVLTGSPFGVQLIAGVVPLFDPYAWDPNLGLDQAIGLLGWRCEHTDGGTTEDALARLRDGLKEAPVLVGPVELGLLLHQPGADRAVGADHFVVALEADDERILFHDPQGYPYASLPVEAFVEAWRADQIKYTRTPFAMRSSFTRQRVVVVDEALRASLPAAVGWLSGHSDPDMPPGSLGGREAVIGLADQVEAGLDPGIRSMLVNFGIRVGARRLNDAAVCLARIGLAGAAGIAAEQSRTLGGVQYTVLTDDRAAASQSLRRLAPMYDQMREALKQESA